MPNIQRLLSVPCLVLFSILSIGGSLEAGRLEEAYAKYVQGQYEQAQIDLMAILSDKPTAEEAYKMQQDLGLRAFLEMSQNRLLTQEIRSLGALAWQFERTQFKNYRRVNYYLNHYLEDESLRAKALMNLLSSGEYAIAPLLDHLGAKEVDVAKRGLSYQAILRMGREAVPGMLAGTFSSDPILLVNIIRLLGEIADPRALPYLLRLKEISQDNNVLAELNRVMPTFADPRDSTANMLMIAEACRYLREDQACVIEALSSDGLIWEWNTEAQSIQAVNLLQQVGPEFLPSLPPNLWPFYRAEMIIYEMTHFTPMNNEESFYARAALICAWASQENRAAELLKDTATAKVSDYEALLQTFLKRRTLEVEVSHWAGAETLLAALDLSARQFGATVTARILQVLTVYHPPRLLETQLISFLDGRRSNPVIDALHHPDELVRYWAAIAAGRANTRLDHPSQSTIIDLLIQSVDEVSIRSVLLVAEVDQRTEILKKALTGMGYNVYQVQTGYDGLNALREFPSKDLVIVSNELPAKNNLSAIEFVDRMRKDYKGKDLPIGMLCTEDNKAKVLAGFQDHSQGIILHGESGEILREKMAAMEKKMKSVVFDIDIVREVSRESLTTLMGLDTSTLRSYPKIIAHLGDLLANPFHKREHEMLAVSTLKNFGELAFATTPILLDKLWDKTKDDEYKINVLTTLRHTSRAHPRVQEALFELVGNHDVARAIRIQAASYLGLDTLQSTEAAKKTFQDPFFTRSYSIDEKGSAGEL